MKKTVLLLFVFVLFLSVSCTNHPVPPAATDDAITAGMVDTVADNAAPETSFPDTTGIPEADLTAPSTTAPETKIPEATASETTVEETATKEITAPIERIEESQGIFYKTNGKWYFSDSNRFFLPDETEGRPCGNIPFGVLVNEKFSYRYFRDGDFTEKKTVYEYSRQKTAAPGQDKVPVLYLDENCGLCVCYSDSVNDGISQYIAALYVTYDGGKTFSPFLTFPMVFNGLYITKAVVSITAIGNSVYVTAPVPESLFQSTQRNHSQDHQTDAAHYEQLLRFRYENGALTEYPFSDSDPSVLSSPFDLSVSEPGIFYSVAADGEIVVISGFVPYSVDSPVKPVGYYYFYYVFFLYSTDGGESWRYYDPQLFQH